MTSPDGEQEATVMHSLQIARTYREGLTQILMAEDPQFVETLFSDQFARVAKQLTRLLDAPHVNTKQALRAYHALLILVDETPTFPSIDMDYVARVWKQLKRVRTSHVQSSLEEDALCSVLVGLGGRCLLELYCSWRKTTFPFAEWFSAPSLCI